VAFVSIIGVGLIGYWGWLGVEIYNQGKDIAKIQTVLSPQLIKDDASNPDNPRSAKEALRLLHSAVDHGNQIDPKIVSEAGEKFVLASSRNPSAWQTGLEFAAYRSKFNSSPRIVHMMAMPTSGSAVYFFHEIAGMAHPSVSAVHGTNVPIPGDTALMLRLGMDKSNEQDQLAYGAFETIASGGALSLDHVYYRHVTLENVEVHYSGKPMILEDVVFINCKFIFDNTDPSRKLTQNLLADSSVSFSQTAG
jgi:hypothetical protein